MGSRGSHHFRPERLAAGALRHPIICKFSVDGARSEMAQVLDVSTTGVALSVAPDMVCAPGTLLDQFRVCYGDVEVWSGDAVVIYQTAPPSPRLGVRFTSGLMDINSLRMRDSLQGGGLSTDLQTHARQRERIPDNWRAQVADTRHLLLLAERKLSDLANGDVPSTLVDAEKERAAIAALYDEWAPHFHRQLAALHELSKGLAPEDVELARAYAEEQLFPLMKGCPLHARSHDKPNGYAGDYQTMLLCSGPDHLGQTAFDRFLYYVARRYTMVKTVPERQRSMQTAVERTVASAEGPTRIVALASGPAVELTRFLEARPRLRHPLQLVLVDQDAEALAYANDALERALTGPGERPQVKIDCIHLSVKQILKPADAATSESSRTWLGDADLIYSAGLFDYLPDPVARALMFRLYGLLSPGGRLFIGNLRETPDTTWLLEYVLSWHLVYRTPESMLALATGLNPSPRTTDIAFDATERCMFWDILKPGRE